MANFKTIVLLTFLGMVHFSLYAQWPGQGQRFLRERVEGQREAIKARRIAHITDQLSLTPAEAERFWPIYNEYLEEFEELSQKYRIWQRQFQPIDQLSDNDAAILAESEVKRLEESARLRRVYHEKLKDALPIRKIALLYEAERSFNSALLRETQHRYRGRP